MKERAAAMLPLMLLIILAAATYWLNRVVQGDNPRGPMRHDPDFIVDQFVVRRFDTTGRLQNTIVADQMKHFPDNDSTLVTKPHLTYHQVPPTEVFALNGRIGADGKEVDLSGKVRIVRHGADGAAATVINTETLKVFPDEERGFSNSPVVITQGNSIMNGSGLEFDNRSSISVLRGRVSGTLHRNQKASP